ncbi:LOW QUALITY PROTEIN: hypothetical protein TorRG33x02_133340 [Trema orientale]|uniref:Uncharacterized protein n=1 Tax=Trema orientale TaxID=63057 RepID=A0A2P5EZH6_TREOI|nr:LOW QUALITY PROTEIN: hypothetical protein TorRG33x02_133340 [Trema orientale]
MLAYRIVVLGSPNFIFYFLTQTISSSFSFTLNSAFHCFAEKHPRPPLSLKILILTSGQIVLLSSKLERKTLSADISWTVQAAQAPTLPPLH